MMKNSASLMDEVLNLGSFISRRHSNFSLIAFSSLYLSRQIIGWLNDFFALCGPLVFCGGSGVMFIIGKLKAGLKLNPFIPGSIGIGNPGNGIPVFANIPISEKVGKFCSGLVFLLLLMSLMFMVLNFFSSP